VPGLALRLSTFLRKFISPAIALRSSSAKRVRNVVGRGLALRPLFFLWKIIGPPGFEPGTSSTPRKRATRLRYGPKE